MHAERDWLGTHVFPELAERLRTRFHHLEVVDLRWGVDVAGSDLEQTRELVVLKVCLGEIERSRPFLIGLIGDRYGWIPPAERAASAAAEMKFESPVHGKSVTEIEIAYGVLHRPEQSARSWFYIRDPLPYDRMPRNISARYSDAYGDRPDMLERLEKMASLKALLRTRLPERVRSYAADWDPVSRSVVGLDAWGKQVVSDLWADLEAETASFLRSAPATWQDQDRWVLDEFVETKTRGFVGRTAITSTLLELATSSTAEDRRWGACVTGEAGAGKSSLFAHVCRSLRERHVLVLFHAAGIASRSTEVSRMVRRWVGELAHFLDERDPLNDAASSEEIDDTFSRLLVRAASRIRVVVLVDAIDQFEPTPRGSAFLWLPTTWPMNARFIATAVLGLHTETLLKRSGIEEDPLTSLQSDEAIDIVRGICQRYHRTINQEVLDAILEKRRDPSSLALSNPLWLELATEALNLLQAEAYGEADERFAELSGDQRIVRLLLSVVETLPADVEGLYMWTLDDAKRRLGGRWTRAFVDVIAVSRAGWRESDLARLMPILCGETWDPLRFATLRRWLRAHVTQRGAYAQWNFAHAQLQRAVLDRLGDSKATVSMHETITRHLETLSPDDPLRCNELMFHLIRVGDPVRVARHYAEHGLPSAALTAATGALADFVATGITENLWVGSLTTRSGLDPSERGVVARRFSVSLNLALQERVGLPPRLLILRSAERALMELTDSDRQKVGWQAALAENQLALGDLLNSRGDFQAARATYESAWAAAERVHRAGHEHGDAELWMMMASSNIGALDQIRGDRVAALAAYRRALSVAQAAATRSPDDSVWSRNVSVNHVRIGDLLALQEDHATALDEYKRALKIRQELATVPADSAIWPREIQLRDVLVCHTKIGDSLRAQGQIDAAMAELRNALVIGERLIALDPTRLAWRRELAQINTVLGHCSSDVGELVDARRHYGDAFAIRTMLSRADPTNTQWLDDLWLTCLDVGKSAQRLGELDAAVGAFHEAVSITRRLAQLKSGHTMWTSGLLRSYELLAGAFEAGDDTKSAIVAHRDRARLLEEATTAGRPDAEALWDLSWTYARIGSLLAKQGEAQWATKAYQSSVVVAERLAQIRTNDAGLLRDIAVSLYKIGGLLLSEDDLDGAHAAFLRAREVLRGMASRGMVLDSVASQLAEHLNSMPD